ncbi:hypothetical protein P0F65_05250 [Sphingomonas sp. I4]
MQENPEDGRATWKALDAIGKRHGYTVWAIEDALKSPDRPRSQREQDADEVARQEAERPPERDLLLEGERAARKTSQMFGQLKIAAIIVLPIALLLAYCASQEGDMSDDDKRHILCVRGVAQSC